MSASVTNTDDRRPETNERATAPIDDHRIAFAGDPGVGTTTVATLVAARLADRTRVAVEGEASSFVDDREEGGSLGIDWTIVDLPSGPETVEDRAATVDTVFVVATPDTLDTVSAYERTVAATDADCFLIVTRFTEDDRDRLREFDGPDLAEYIYEDDSIETAMAAGTVPTLEDWTLEAIALESLQSDRLEADAAVDALEDGRRSIVNVEVPTREEGDALLARFENRGYAGAYFGCNCRCHDGHVLAMARDD